MNEQYFSRETIELLPSEQLRRAELSAELKRVNERRRNLQAEFDRFIMSDLCEQLFGGEINMNDEQTKYFINLMDEIDNLSFSAASLRRDITRLDAGETLADIYKSIFG